MLVFGGQVMKNVAGYDVSRASLAGSLGTLGLIVEASLKVLPVRRVRGDPGARAERGAALEALNRWAGQPLPISATAWQAAILGVRLSGSGARRARRRAKIGGSRWPRAGAVLARRARAGATRFSPVEALWRLAVPSATSAAAPAGRS